MVGTAIAIAANTAVANTVSVHVRPLINPGQDVARYVEDEHGKQVWVHGKPCEVMGEWSV